MSSTIIFSISALCYTLILVFVFFSKKNYDSLENKIYSKLIIATFLGLIIEISAVFVLLGDNKILSFLQMKGYLIYLITWISLFTLYVIATFKKEIRYLPLGIVLYTLSIFAILILPTNIYNNDGMIYTYGPSINFVYLYSLACLILMAVYIVKNFKQLFKRKYLPIPLLVVLGVIVLVIQTLNPGLLLISSAEAIITFIMYFTIENPDLKVIKELNKNKKIIENANQGNLNFMFKITTEAKHYLKNMLNLSKKIESPSEVKQEIIDVTNEMGVVLNNVIDVSSMDIKNIKISGQSYSPRDLFKEIKLKYKDLNKNVEFIVNISNNFPDKLYGDVIRLKQIIYSVIENSLKNTTNGFIAVEINSIVKYDMCRLIITIEDSGIGMRLEKVNEILNFNENVVMSDIEQAQTMDMNLKMVKKFVNLLGGSLLLSSTKNKGTKVTIVLDQLVADTVKINLEDNLAQYNNALDIRNVLVIDDDSKELAIINKIFSEMEIDGVCAMDGNDCLNRIRLKQNFDMIILDDTMETLNAVEIIKKLNLKNVPIVVMLDEKKMTLSKHYIKEGFTDVINKNILETEIKRVIYKHLK